MKLAKKFTFRVTGRGETVYTAEEDDGGVYIVTWEPSPNFTGDPYTTYPYCEVERYIINAEWRVLEVIIGPEAPYEPETTVSLETGDESVSVVWPFPVSSVTGAVDTIPAALDDIPDAVPAGFSLAVVREFFKSFPQYTLELDEEYMVVKPVENAAGERNVVYLVRTEVELESVMEAIRTLERFADRG